MSHIIDRRLNGKNKSAVNRERFLRRFKAQIKEAVGKAIKGRSMPVQFPVAIKTVAGKTRIEGRLPVSRLGFSIGEGEWKDTGLVADEVVIEFSLVVPPADGAAATTPPAQTQQQSRSKDNSKESNK